MRVTGSKLALLAECGWWARDDAEWAERTSDSASFGKQLHACCEAFIEGRCLMAADDAVLDVFRRVVEPWLRDNLRLGWRAEIPFALDPFAGTARELPKGGHRDYTSGKPDEVCMTLDACYMGEDSDGAFACVDDFKWSGFHGDEAKAEAQLTGQAIAVALAYGVDRVRARAIRISEARVDDTSEVYWLDTFDLLAAREAMARQLDTVATAEARRGDWCTQRWCPAISVCPETSRALEPALVPAAALLKRFPFTTAIESADHLQALMQMNGMVEAAHKAVKDAIREYVGDREVVCTDGTTVKATYRTMPRESREELVAAFLKLGGTQEQLDACVHPRIEPAGIKALKPRKPAKGRAA